MQRQLKQADSWTDAPQHHVRFELWQSYGFNRRTFQSTAYFKGRYFTCEQVYQLSKFSPCPSAPSRILREALTFSSSQWAFFSWPRSFSTTPWCSSFAQTWSCRSCVCSSALGATRTCTNTHSRRAGQSEKTYQTRVVGCKTSFYSGRSHFFPEQNYSPDTYCPTKDKAARKLPFVFPPWLVLDLHPLSYCLTCILYTAFFNFFFSIFILRFFKCILIIKLIVIIFLLFHCFLTKLLSF